ncbi:DUF6129 family protein [Methylicorpusculum sp.]|uniref:DUF6129 family protein n=1 Tax=Methylicorpusculum sp. TaxID=2713644 RepID=UPI002716DB6D|nr:DUF6129 family protein [Methylicorpusculum sp.]MDO8846554.1 DUF6129 family protein [Methylicorpusculum sp.]MDP2178727.1 DUF6129 family protein [Methylicorpusculum sp.]MDP3531659.1 DUF6129 family protein [Methylicorpusculum sp.]MDZ4153212.1 DUF6129 family protein [Methylicorpusculum sp.]
MINPQLTQTIAETIASQGIDETVIGLLREQHPGIHFTYCMDDDIPDQSPVLEHPEFNLYLVDGKDHCLCLTQSYEQASGFVVAEIVEYD